MVRFVALTTPYAKKAPCFLVSHYMVSSYMVFELLACMVGCGEGHEPHHLVVGSSIYSCRTAAPGQLITTPFNQSKSLLHPNDRAGQTEAMNNIVIARGSNRTCKEIIKIAN